MIRSLLTTAAALVAMTTTSATAFDIDAMSDEERAAFRTEIRAYLLDNPEVLMEAIQVLEQRQSMTEADRDIALVAAHTGPLFNDGFSWVGGNPEGDVTVVEFLDYRCGFCKRAFPEVERLVASDGNIRLIVKEFPILGPQSELASRFAIATKEVEGDAAYKAIHDALMAFRGQISQESLERLAVDQGLDSVAILQNMNSDAVNQVLAANRALGQAMGITGTPTFVVGEQMLRGFLPLDGMRAVVEEERG